MGTPPPQKPSTPGHRQSAAARDPESDTAQSGFDSRAQSAADRHENEATDDD